MQVKDKQSLSEGELADRTAKVQGLHPTVNLLIKSVKHFIKLVKLRMELVEEIHGARVRGNL